jgi:hypothetical protein
MSSEYQLQTNNKTFLSRHWAEHNVLRRHFDTDRGISILSFGCSTGEELLSIRALFPRANLFGCDIDWQNLVRARALLGATAEIFHSSDSIIEDFGPFDIILCNSVLLASSENFGIDRDLWLRVVSLLDCALKPGGIIQIINSNIPFRYHPVFKNYQLLPSALIYNPNFVDQFDLEGLLLCRGVGGAGWSPQLNRHIAGEGWLQLLPTDFDVVHFRKNGGCTPNKILDDEIIPNLSDGAAWASGITSYRTEVDVKWITLGVYNVRLERTVRRIWFDGSIIANWVAKVDLEGPEAAVFIESTLGRRSSRISFDSVFNAQAIRSPS